MFNKLNNKVLTILFGALLISVIVVLVFDRKSGNKSADLRNAYIANVDTSKITDIIIKPSGEENEIKISIASEGWNVSSGDIMFPANPQTITGMLQNLASIKLEQIASKSEEQWENYLVSDSSGTHLIVKEGDNITADLIIGRFSYQQLPQNQMMQQMGGYGAQNMKFSTFVRNRDEKIVYMIDGMMSMTFNIRLNDLRNKRICSVSKQAITSISFRYPADSSFTLILKENKWLIDNIEADSLAVVEYINTISSLNGNYFVDDFNASSSPAYNVSINGNNFASITINAYNADHENQFAIQSNMNPHTYFSGLKGSLFSKIFINRQKLLSK